MSATRLLVLGVVRMHGTAHGYLITSELESMWAQEWAKLKSGSIYHALRQLAKDGLMRATQIEEWPGRVDYEITEQGDAEFLRLLRQALKRPDPRPDLLAAALVLLTELPRAEAVALLKERLAAQEAERDRIADRIAADESDRLGELFEMLKDSVDSNITLTLGLLHRLESGAHVMAGDEP
ncbi:PadR family transcriptional regulator [Streptomyces scopuliridis]|uniref:PadR family transcriptional regulator n=1 Tax=Streptomyces scopuliridis TaxID=452529 RepID=UPI0034316C56